jgi:hypothetical protein
MLSRCELVYNRAHSFQNAAGRMLLYVRASARRQGIRNLARLCFRTMLTLMLTFASPLNN